MWQKVKLLKMSNFTIFHNLFSASCSLKAFNSHISVVVCGFFEFGTVSKWCTMEWVNQRHFCIKLTQCIQWSSNQELQGHGPTFYQWASLSFDIAQNMQFLIQCWTLVSLFSHTQCHWRKLWSCCSNTIDCMFCFHVCDRINIEHRFMMNICLFNPLPDVKILDRSKLKQIADNILKRMTKKCHIR